MAFKEGVVLGTVSVNATGTGTTAIGATSNSGTINIGNTSSGAIAIDCGVAGINVGATANAHTSTFGSTSGASATTVQSGSGALNVTATNGALTINSGTGTLSISSDASATTVNIATGGAAKLVTLGSTNGASSLALKTGTADFTLASATGTIISALDTGQITYPLQPKFLAYNSAPATNVTGDGTAYTVINATVSFDIGSNYNNGTGKFTAPVTGYYLFTGGVLVTQLAVAHTQLVMDFYVNAVQWVVSNINPYPISVPAAGDLLSQGSLLINMSAGQTAEMRISVVNGTKVVDVTGGAQTFFAGELIG